MREGDVGTIATTDLNFAGYGDLFVASQLEGARRFVWGLFDPTTNQYVASRALSQLMNSRADAATKEVTAYEHTGCGGFCYNKQHIVGAMDN